MLTFRDYIKKAKENSHIDSNNDVAEILNISSAAVAKFCTEKSRPSQETVLRLAKLAKISPEEALVDYNLWKTKDKPNAHKVWLRISKMVQKSSLILLLSTYPLTNCYSHNTPPHLYTDKMVSNIHYATNIGDINEHLYVLLRPFM